MFQKVQNLVGDQNDWESLKTKSDQNRFLAPLQIHVISGDGLGMWIFEKLLKVMEWSCMDVRAGL